jgi:glutamate dehydrogenase (NAD(P)+)
MPLSASIATSDSAPAPTWSLGQHAPAEGKMVVEGANIPLTEGAEKFLHDRGVLCIPDFIANSGGVICAAMEYLGKIESEAMEVIEKKVLANTRLILEESRIKNITPREAAVNLAVTRVEKAMSFKRWSIYCGRYRAGRPPFSI